MNLCRRSFFRTSEIQYTLGNRQYSVVPSPENNKFRLSYLELEDVDKGHK